MRALVSVAVVALALLPALGSTTDALQPLSAAVALRHDAADPSTHRGRLARRRLDRLGDALATPTQTLAADMAVARRVGRILRAEFPRDAEFAPLYAAGVADLATAADLERVRFAQWTGKLADPVHEATLETFLEEIGDLMTRAARAGGTSRELRLLRRGCGLIDDARAALELADDPPVAGPPMPDFSLPDVNPNSPSFAQKVSPRDLLGKNGAWYFGHAT